MFLFCLYYLLCVLVISPSLGTFYIPPPSDPGPTAAAVALTVRAPQAPRRAAPGPTAPLGGRHRAPRCGPIYSLSGVHSAQYLAQGG